MALVALIEKVTDPRLPGPDYPGISRLVELVDRDKVEAEDAVQLVQHKILDENPNTVCLALRVLEALFNQCGNVVHRLVCTGDYMSLLKKILKNTQYNQVQLEILKLLIDWTERFKFFPKYSAPKDLLENLIEEGFVNAQTLKNIKIEVESSRTSLRQSNGVRANGQSQYSSSTAFSESHPSKPSANAFCGKTMPNDNKSMDHVERRSADFNLQWEKIKSEQKRRHKEYRKKNGLPTSSDEDEMVTDRNTSPDPRLFQDKMENDHAIRKKLPKELEIMKQQRENLTKQANNIRREKHQKYTQNCSNYDQNLRQCILDNCDECQKYKNNQKEELIFAEKQLPLEMKKIKESKKILNDSWQEVRSRKNREYHNRNNRSSMPVNGSHQRNSVMTSDDEHYRTARQQSQTRHQSSIQASTSNVGDLEEERLLQEVLERSRRETRYQVERFPNGDGEDEIQRAISMSLIESEQANFHAMPADLDEDLQMSFAQQLYLDEQRKSLLGDEGDLESCCVCQDLKPLKRFKPCNHKCICDDCLKSYKADTCVLCRRSYRTVEFD